MTRKRVGDGLRKAIKHRQGYLCLVCGKVYPNSQLTIHHKLPTSKGGESIPENLVAWCCGCHEKYHIKYGNKPSDNYGKPL